MPLARNVASFPLWPVTNDGKCGCGNAACASVGKHPIYKWRELGVGQKMAGPAGCGYGICTGMRSGFFVVDLDGEDAMQWWADRCAAADVEPWDTYSVNTARGAHLYFALPADGQSVKNSAGKIGPGVDIRGEGGFVCAPGTRHKSGVDYTEQDPNAPVLDAPAWLLEMSDLYGAAPVNLGEGTSTAPTPVDVTTPLGKERVRLGQAACATMPPSIQGENGSGALWAVALKLVRGLELPLDVAFDLIDGIYNPRCAPPWEDDLIAHKLVDARDKSALPTGPGLSDEEHSAFVARLKATARGKLPPGAPLVRRMTDPSHEYGFVPGLTERGYGDKEIEKDTPLISIASLLTTHENWAGALQWDVFKERLVAVNPPLKMDAEKSGLSDADIAHVRMWLEWKGYSAGVSDTYAALQTAARATSFHPIKDYLESCRGRGSVDIFDDLAAWLFGATDPLAQKMLCKTLVAAVRRIYRPGTQVDTMLVLTGKQGARKSTFVRELFGAEYTRSQMPDLESKDSSVALQGFWGIELAELDKILRAGNETVLEFLARTVDDFRAPYARCESHIPRACVFIGTTNADDFLRDANGHRRYWPILVTMINLEYLRAHRDEIWGAALALAEDPTFEHWFANEDDVKPAHEPFTMQDPWHEDVAKHLEGKVSVALADVFVCALNGEIKDFDKSKQMRLSDTLKRLGCVSKKSNGKRLFFPPVELASIVKETTSKDQLKRRFEQ